MAFAIYRTDTKELLGFVGSLNDLPSPMPKGTSFIANAQLDPSAQGEGVKIVSGTVVRHPTPTEKSVIAAARKGKLDVITLHSSRTMTRVVTIAKIQDEKEAKHGVSEWCNRQRGQEGQCPPELMLPTYLSPTGQLPATHCACFAWCPDDLTDDMVATAKKNKLPVDITLGKEPEEVLVAKKLVVIPKALITK